METTANGIVVRYETHGSPRAPALVLAHSLFLSRAAWDPIIETLAETFRVIAYDLRGHGETDAPEGPYRVALLADDAVALLDSLDIERAHFVGLALGGLVGQVLAASRPDRVDRLVLAATRMRTAPEAAESWDAHMEVARTEGLGALINPFLDRWLTGSVAPALRTRMAEMMRATPLAGFIGACAAIRDHDARSLMGDIAAPTLVVTGSRDVGTPPAEGDALAARIKGAVHETIADCGHQIAMQRPEAFLAAIRGHLGAGT